jgi:predicted RNA-binding Zn-ribbon protein involved in translation (DUF1610 family)
MNINYEEWINEDKKENKFKKIKELFDHMVTIQKYMEGSKEIKFMCPECGNELGTNYLTRVLYCNKCNYDITEEGMFVRK